MALLIRGYPILTIYIAGVNQSSLQSAQSKIRAICIMYIYIYIYIYVDMLPL